MHAGRSSPAFASCAPAACSKPSSDVRPLRPGDGSAASLGPFVAGAGGLRSPERARELGVGVLEGLRGGLKMWSMPSRPSIMLRAPVVNSS